MALGRMTIGLACIVVLAAACSSSNKHAVPGPAPTTTTPAATTLQPARHGDALIFREVIATLPYNGGTAGSCQGGKRVTPNAKDTAAAQQVILPDRVKTVCYVLSRTLLTGRNISNVVAEQVPTTADWGVTVHFANDDFVNKVGRPLVGKNIAIIFDHIVQSAPVIREVINSRDVMISGNFTEAEARALVSALR